MKSRKLMMLGTVAVAITLSAGLKNETTETERLAAPPSLTQHAHKVTTDNFLAALGASEDQEITDSLMNGNSLADIAEANGQSTQSVIDLQVAELSEQLYWRLKSGQITPSAYRSQLAELTDIVTKSTYGIAHKILQT